MPNYVTNVVQLGGNPDLISRVLTDLKTVNEEGKENFFDFNKIEKCPDELNNVVSPVRIVSEKEYKAELKRIERGELKDYEKSFGVSLPITEKIRKEYISKFGTDNWYDWRINNWGVKWNCSDSFKIDENTIEFLTAWSTPIQIIEKLSLKYPELEISVRYADEDFGYNVGEYTFIGGEIISQNIPKGGTYEALKLAIDITGDEEYRLGEGLIEYDADDEEISEYLNNLVKIAVEMEYLSDEIDYPKGLIDLMTEMAIKNEQYEFAERLKSVPTLEE